MATSTNATKKRHRVTEYELKHYVEYFSYFNYREKVYETVEIKERDPSLVKHLNLDRWGYRFFDRTEAIVDGEKLLGSKKNFSEITWFRDYPDDPGCLYIG